VSGSVTFYERRSDKIKIKHESKIEEEENENERVIEESEFPDSPT